MYPAPTIVCRKRSMSFHELKRRSESKSSWPTKPFVFGSHVICFIILTGSKQSPNGRVRGSKPAELKRRYACCPHSAW